MTATLSDAEIDAICAPLRQGAAQVRYLRDVLRVPVQRKPNGRPLVRRCDWERERLTRGGEALHEPPPRPRQRIRPRAA